MFVGLLVLSASPSYGNGGGYHVGVDFTGQIAPFSPLGTEQVQILDEKLDIVLKHDHADVNVRYLMRNVGSRRAKVTFGFPVEDIIDQWRRPEGKGAAAKAPLYCKNYQVVLNGSPLKSQYRYEPFGAKGGVKSFAGSERFAGIKGWMVSEMSIPKGGDIVMEIHYRSQYDEGYMSISEDMTHGPWIFKYRLSTGGVWHGPIKKGVVSVRAEGVRFQDVRIVTPVNRFKKYEQSWVWEFKNLEPGLNDDIEIYARPGEQRYGYYGDEKDILGYQVRNENWYLEHLRYQVNATSELAPQKEITYAASNVKGRWEEKAFAWVEGKEGHGLGERLQLKLDQPTRLHALEMVNGYAKNDDLFLANSRVKDMTVVINGTTKIKHRLEDNRAPQWITLSGLKTEVSKIDIRIDSVYAGTKYQDTCISSVSLIEKLKQKPKRYGAR